MSAENLFNLNDDELSLANTKNSNKNKLGFAVLLKYFQLEGHYPKHVKFVDPLMLNCIANQLNINPTRIDNFDWEGRSTERYRREIREFLGVDSLGYLSLEGMVSSVSNGKSGFCTACFTGKYPLRPEDDMAKLQLEDDNNSN